MSKRVPLMLVALVALFGLVAVALNLASGESGSTAAPATSVVDATDGSGTTTPMEPATTTTTEPPLSPTEEAQRSAHEFLDRYVQFDGRVQREPEGDTVSEGQAYAMLLAVAVDDATTFATVWNWTRTNLLGASGSLAWHWADGAVVDPNAATDADVDAARALLLAADRFAVPAYRADGTGLADALMRVDVVQDPSGPVFTAGPWAVSAPYVVNPSYLSPVAFDGFAVATGDARWTAVRQTAVALLTSVTNSGASLPPDWAAVDAGGSARPAAAPDGAAVAYGYEAFRTLPRLAEACDAASRALVAAMWDPAGRTIDGEAATSNLDGSLLTIGDNPLLLIGAASAAQAAGDSDQSDALLDEAQQAYETAPSYYLGAWVAMARVLLDTDLLGGCALSAPAAA